MRVVPESDKGVALAAGAFTLLLFVVGIAIVSATSPTGVGTFELVGFAAGFTLFITIYFLSMNADRILKGDDKEQ
jgi:tellurite resistance protein TehA-like permease